MTTIDPVDNLTFWHTNEYYPVTSSANWFTRIGKFQFPAASPTPTRQHGYTATATATATPHLRNSHGDVHGHSSTTSSSRRQLLRRR